MQLWLTAIVRKANEGFQGTEPSKGLRLLDFKAVYLGFLTRSFLRESWRRERKKTIMYRNKRKKRDNKGEESEGKEKE